MRKESTVSIKESATVSDETTSLSSFEKTHAALHLVKTAAQQAQVSPSLGLFNREGSLAELSPGFERQRSIASNPQLAIEERLEAYEDIFESQVGDTNFVRARNIEREVGFRQLYLKFEGGNPTGTQKDRVAFVQAMDALRRGYDTITVATCGNYGVATAIAASLAGLRCLVFIPEAYHTKRAAEITAHGAEIVRVPVDYETAVTLSRQRAQSEGLYDANPGGANTAIQLRAYGEIAYEIYDELRDAPAVVALPVSNGTTLAGVYRGFLSLYRRGKTSRMPKIVAGSCSGRNPIVQAYLDRRAHCEDLNPESIRETAVNEPLVNWQSIDGEAALQAVRETSGWAGYVSDKSMQACSKFVRDKEGMNVLPASTAGLLTLIEQHGRQALPGDRYVVVLTGRKN